MCTRALKKSARMKAVDKCYRDASALLRKARQNSLTGIIRLALVLGRYIGRIAACLKNAIGRLCPICDPNPYIQKGYFKQRSEKVKEIQSSLVEKKLSFANLDLRLDSRGRKSPFVVQ